VTHGLYTPSALLFVSETTPALAQAAHLMRIERLTRANSPHTPLVNENLTDLRAERCATRHISDLPRRELDIPCRFHWRVLNAMLDEMRSRIGVIAQTLRLERLCSRAGAAGP
jgi:hypothetical protein